MRPALFLFWALVLSLLPGFGAPDFGASFGDDSLGWLAESESWETDAEISAHNGFGPAVAHDKSNLNQPVTPASVTTATRTTSSFVDPSVHDFDVTFAYGASDIGMALEEHHGKLLVTSLEDSKSAELSGLVRKGDQLLAISGEPVSTMSSRDEVQTRLHALQEVGWFRLRFRPARLQRRVRRQLHDHNVTVQLLDGGGTRLGMVLSTGLAVISILPGQIFDDGRTNIGDRLIAVDETIVTGASLAYVAEFISSVTGPLVLRFRLSISERQRVDRKAGMMKAHASDVDDAAASDIRKSTFEVRFETLQSLGLEISDRLVVTGFHASARDGVAPPAEQSGKIQVGDTVLSVNGVRATDSSTVRHLLAQKTHEEVLRCRGKTVTRYCSIERVRPTSTVRIIAFRVGPRQRRGGRTYPEMGRGIGDARVVDAAEAAIRDQIEVVPSSGEAVRRQRYYVMSQGNAITNRDKGDQRTRKALAPSGLHEAVFRTSRGLVVSKNFTADFSTALFGGALWCGAHRLVVASPISACQALNDEDHLRDAYVVVRRGGCFFTAKAINAQFAGAAGIIVIDHEPIANTYASPRQTLSPASLLPMRMPASSTDGHLINIPAVMVSHRAGERLLAAVRMGARGQHLFLKLMPENPGERSCPASSSDDLNSDQNGTWNRKRRHHALEPTLRTDQAGGRIFIRRGDVGWRDLEFATALFSGPFELGTLADRRVVLANPRNGCSTEAGEAEKYRGAVVIAERGDCALVEKAILAQKMHASAIVIVNDRSCALERMQSWMTMYQPGHSNSGGVKIPAVLVSKHAGKRVIASLAANNNDDDDEATEPVSTEVAATEVVSVSDKVLVDGRQNPKTFWAHFRANSSHLDLWERLGEVKSPNSWPADKSARDDLFAQLAVLHHPDRPTGHVDRYECLVAARENVERYHLHRKIVQGQ
jgi:C-terminal processing protease CtpA/Prc